MRVLLSTLILMTLTHFAVAQRDLDSFTFKMYVTPLVRISGGDLECAIERRVDNLKLTYQYRDSVSRNYYRDKRTQRLLASYRSNRNAATMDSIRSLENAYSFYRKDRLEVLVREYRSFVDLLQQIIAMPKEALEDLEADKKIPVFDGASYSFQMQTKHEKKMVSSLNLDSTLHPLLYQVSTQIMTIYKNEKHRDFLGASLTAAFSNRSLTAKTEQNTFFRFCCNTETSRH